MIRILLADDHHLILEGITLMLSGESDMHIIGRASDGEQLLKLLKEQQPDLILIDINMPGESGISITQKVKQSYPQIRVIGLSMHREFSLIKAMALAGADGYLLKDCEKEEIIRAIRRVVQGQTYFPEEIQEELKKEKLRTNSPPGHFFPSLSRREKEVLRLIVEEYTTAEIAEKLFISFNTVESHRKNILIKLGARNTAGLVRICMEHNLLSPEK